MKTLVSAAVVIASAFVSASNLSAQVRIQTAPGAFAYTLGDPDRPMIGVSTRSSGKRDTLGLLVESVTREGPADKAGIEEGDRLVSANGVNLRLAPADAGESDMDGIATRRLVRELEKRKAGDEVELQVYRDGNTRTLRVATVAAQELNAGRLATTNSAFRQMADRAVLGLSLGGSGSRRDTLGILVVAVSNDGPAAKASVDEGDRIAAINGVDLRVAAEDAGDWQASSARVNRLNREMEKVKAGDAVELRVYSGEQVRTVRVESVKASDLRGEAFFFNGGSGNRIRSMVMPRSGSVRVFSGAEMDAMSNLKAELERSVQRARTTTKVLGQQLRAAPRTITIVRSSSIIE